MLDIITVIMRYYFQSGLRSVWFQFNAGRQPGGAFCLGPLKVCSACLPSPRWELVKQRRMDGLLSKTILVQSCSKNISIPIKAKSFFCLRSLQIAVLGSDIVGVCTSKRRGRMGQAGGPMGREGRKVVRGTGAEAELVPKFLSEGLLLWCFWALLLLLYSRASWKEQHAGKKYHRGRKEAIIAGCLFVANRMLKWQICKFVREESLVFIFISQSGFLLAEQQARKRPILTT